MTTYAAIRDPQGVVHLHRDSTEITPERSLKLFNHSPTGFEMGYGGSGPAQLALAILADFLSDDETAVRLHQQFKSDFLLSNKAELFITAEQVQAWLAQATLPQP